METSNIGEIQKTEKKFKSYYVVWKPVSHTENADYIESLNRTM